jgi:integrase
MEALHHSMRRSTSLSLPLFGPEASVRASVTLLLAAPAPIAAANAPRAEREGAAVARAPYAEREVPPEAFATTVPVTAHTELAALVVRANDYAEDMRARSTRRAYGGDFRVFAAWCAARGLDALPATSATVAVYLAAQAGEGRRPSTIGRSLAGIAHAHRERGCLWPRGDGAIAKVMRGIRRRHGAPPVQKAALDDGDLAAMVGVLGEALVDRRDRALLTLGWLGAFRRSELASLRLEDVTRTREGLVVRLRRSKGDQEGKGEEKGIPYALQAPLCPVRALEAWLEASGIRGGPLFRAVDRGGRVHAGALSDRSVARIVQRVAAEAGLDAKRVGGHSLRAGFATTAAKKGRSLDAIMRQTLHKSERQVRSYIRHATVFEGNAAVGLV